MSRVISKPFREAHADFFEAVPDVQQGLTNALPHMAQLGQLHQCDSFILDGKILFVGGYVDLGGGVAEAFIYPSAHAHRHPISFFKEAKWWVNELRTRFRRVQCWGEDTAVSRRWLKHLGFRLEGKLLSFTVEGKAMLIWGATWQD